MQKVVEVALPPDRLSKRTSSEENLTATFARGFK